MYALIDANSFYASAEEVFDPSIRGKPIVVLTNNDGCICALSAAAKSANIESFTPYFKVKDRLQEMNAIVRSSNYPLYADLSNKVFSITAEYGDQHVYSVDEVFLRLKQDFKDAYDWQCLADNIKERVWRSTRIPVGVGISRTPTLAKVASYASKRIKGFNGTAVLRDFAQIDDILQTMPVSKVWGVGKRIALSLQQMGIVTAKDLAQQSSSLIRRRFSVELERTLKELNGEVCFDWHSLETTKRQINASRSFAEPTQQLAILQQAIANHCIRMFNKLRQQHSLVKTLKVFAQSDKYRGDFFKKSIEYNFETPTINLCELIKVANQLIQEIYRPDIAFSKCGVGAVSLVHKDAIQDDLFNPVNTENALSDCIDKVNKRFGKLSIKPARAGFNDNKWNMRQAYLSKEYTTKWQDLPVFKT